MSRLGAYGDVATHEFRQPFADRQSQTGASVLATHRIVGLDEGLKQTPNLLGGHADSRIDDVEPHLACVGPLFDREPDTYVPPLGEFDGIAREIHEDLFQPQWVGPDLRGNLSHEFHRQRKTFGDGSRTKHRSHFDGSPRGVAGDLLHGHLVGFNLADVQDVVDQFHQMPRVPPNHLKRIDPVGHRLHRREHKICVSEDRSHRSTDLVAHICQEVALGAAGVFGFVPGRRQFRGAARHHILQVFAMQRELQVALLDLIEHGVEAIDEHAQLIARGLPARTA